MVLEDEEKEEERRLVAHKMAVKLLKGNPGRHIVTLSDMYAAGTVVPPGDIPELVAAFEEARSTVRSLDIGGYVADVDRAIEALNKQAEEAEKMED